MRSKDRTASVTKSSPRSSIGDGCFHKVHSRQRRPAAAPAYDEGGVGGRINNVADAVANGATFGFGDEIGARLNSWTGYNTETGSYDGNRTYDQELEAIRQRRAGFKEADPIPAFAAELLGGAAPAAAGVGVVSGGGSLAARMGRGAATGAGLGAAYGFGEGEGGLANRAQSGLLSGLVGGAVGGAIPAVADAGRSLYRMGQEAYRNSSIGNQIGNQLGVSPQAGRFIGEAISAENPADMAAALGRAGPDAMLADASPALAGRLDATMRSPVAGAGLARQRVDDRAGEAFYDVMDAIDPGQGPRMGPIAQQNAMRAQARPGVNAAYQQAYNTPIDYASDAGREIESLVKRLPSGTAQRAIRSANERMAYDGTPAAQIMASIADDGTVTMQQMPNVMQLDYLKRAFDEIARDGTDPVTRSMNSDASFASRIARDIREATADAVPAYRDALSSAASDIRQRGAMDTGASLLRPQTTVEEVARSVTEATPAELRAMRQGVVGQMRHILGNVRAIATDQNIEPRQAMQALRELSSPNSQAKLEALYGEAYPQIKQSIDRASAALGLRASTSANSATAARQFADREITESVTQPHCPDEAV